MPLHLAPLARRALASARRLLATAAVCLLPACGGGDPDACTAFSDSHPDREAHQVSLRCEP